MPTYKGVSFTKQKFNSLYFSNSKQIINMSKCSSSRPIALLTLVENNDDDISRDKDDDISRDKDDDISRDNIMTQVKRNSFCLGYY